MRLLITHLLFLKACCGIAWTQAASVPTPDAPLPPILQEWAETQKTLPDMAVAFQQTRSIPALKSPVSTTGRFWKFQDGAFRWELGNPPATVLVHDTSEFRVREASGSPWQTLEENDPRYRMWARFLSGREASPADLSRHFVVKQTDDQPGVATVTLRPKAPFVRRYLRQIDLQISREEKRLLQLRVIQGDQSTLLMTFEKPSSVSAEEKTRLLTR